MAFFSPLSRIRRSIYYKMGDDDKLEPPPTLPAPLPSLPWLSWHDGHGIGRNGTRLDIRPHYPRGAGGTGIFSQCLVIRYEKDITICKTTAMADPLSRSSPPTIGSTLWTPKHIPARRQATSGPSVWMWTAPTTIEGERVIISAIISPPSTMYQEAKYVVVCRRSDFEFHSWPTTYVSLLDGFHSYSNITISRFPPYKIVAGCLYVHISFPVDKTSLIHNGYPWIAHTDRTYIRPRRPQWRIVRKYKPHRRRYLGRQEFSVHEPLSTTCLSRERIITTWTRRIPARPRTVRYLQLSSLPPSLYHAHQLSLRVEKSRTL